MHSTTIGTSEVGAIISPAEKCLKGNILNVKTGNTGGKELNFEKDLEI